MSYAQPTDMQNRYPARDLIQLTDPNSQSIQTAPLLAALSDASVEMDSYLESRFTIPFTDPPVVLIQVCCDIAIYRLNALRPLRDGEDMRKRYEDRIKWLEQVRAGKITLGLGIDNLEPAIAQPTTILQSVNTSPYNQNIFTRSSMKAF